MHAVELYRQALSHHVHEALGELSHLYLGGLHTGTEVVCQPTQQLEAVRLAKLGASLNSPIALSALGRCYLTFGMKGRLELESSLCDSNLVDSLHFQADFASAQAAFANAIELQQHLSAEESARSLQDPWPYYGQGLCLQATDHERAMLCFNQSISMGHTPSKTALQLLDDKRMHICNCC
jgi:tetratricopeptide (TPR) repeat protein